MSPLWISVYLPDHYPHLCPASTPLQAIALSLLQYSPRLALLDDQSLVIEVSASLSLFKGPRNLWQRILASLQNIAVTARTGMAPTALGAWLLARQTQTPQRRVLQTSTLARLLNPLPMDLIPAALPYLAWLHGIGCYTLKDARQLPRSGLQQRSSTGLLQALDAAYITTATPAYTWFQAPLKFSQHYHLTEKLEHSNAVLAVSRRLLEQLCGWLQASHTAATTLHLSMHHEKGRHARPATPLELRLSQDAWLLEDFLPPLTLRLQALVLPAPVISLQLSVTETRPRQAVSQGLFPEPAQWQRQEKRLHDLLRARLGHASLQHTQPVASYLPEQANRWLDTDEPIDATLIPPRLAIASRPFWLLPQPVALSTLNNQPIYKNQPLRLIQGPERLETDWWSEHGHQQRDYFVALAPNAVRYWIYRQQNTLSLRWFLHGLFA
ncbi:MAG: DNA polymerase Y family protein [Burkholderiaceae bacterium]|nr:DNA polymerase Y family protein [Burkholderiaceae bacterium]